MFKKLAIFAAFVILVACSQGSPQQDGSASADTGKDAKSAQESYSPPAPVHLKMFLFSASITDELFQALIAEPTKKKFPYITVELMRETKEQNLNSLIASGDIPDIVYTTNKHLHEVISGGMQFDMRNLMKKQKMDVGVFQPVLIDTIEKYGKQKELYALPIQSNFYATFYNKDLFDKFGVPYPKNGMTWEEALELGKRLNRSEGGVAYRGLDPVSTGFVVTQFSPRWYDANTGQSTYNQPMWQNFFVLFKQLKDADVTEFRTNLSNGPSRDSFAKGQTLAMLPDYGSRMGTLEAAKGLNWDLVTYPTIKDRPNVGMNVDTHLLAITTTSKNKDAALQLIGAVTDKENQLQYAKLGLVSSLQGQDVIDAFAKGDPNLSGKNFKSILSMKPAPMEPIDEFAEISQDELNPAMLKVLQGKADINTALREAFEMANAKIQAAKK